MQRLSRLVFITLIFALLLAIPGGINAGQCFAPGPACYEYWKTDILFVGLVTAIYHPEIAEGENWAPAAVARFSVEEAFRGVKGKEIEIAASIRRSGNVGTSWDGMGYRFEPGQRYLVYAYPSSTNRWMWASSCSRTRRLSEAADDLKYIHGLPKAKPGGSILGTVWRRGEWLQDDQSGPVSGIKVIAQGNNRRFQALTNSRGEYRFNRLKLGTYQVILLVPPNFETGSAGPFDHIKTALKQDRGCMEKNFIIFVDGGVSGKVTDTDGRPVPGVNVDIVAAGFSDEQPDRSWTAPTDEKGRYELRRVPPGAYLLGVNIADVWGVGFDASYYPGVSRREDAQLIYFAEGQKHKNYDFSVPRVTARRTIRGEVRLEGIKPAADALVALESSEDGKPRWDLAVRTDEQGRFSITEHDSYIVWVHARYIGPDGKAKHSEPVRLEKRVGEIDPFAMEATMPGAVCTHYRSQE